MIYRDGELLAAEQFEMIAAGPTAQCGFGVFHGMGTNALFDENTS